MNHTFLNHRSLWSLDNLSSADVAVLLDTASSLKKADRAGHPLRPLRGKNIAVMCESPGDPALVSFTAAATALGAQVAHIRPSSSRITQPNASHETAVVLGRLYDAIECEGMPLSLVQEVERTAGRPVFNGLAEASHPLRVLGDLLTMREHSDKPLSQTTLCVLGAEHSPGNDAWRRAAALTGLALRTAPSDTPTDFLLDAQSPSRCSDGRVELACSCPGEHPPLALEQVDNHRFTLQALLCSTVA
jgi:ornithine carbamoyltransferase